MLFHDNGKMPIRHGQALKTVEKIRLCLLAGFGREKRSGVPHLLWAGISTGICIGLIAILFAHHQVAAAENAPQQSNLERTLSMLQVTRSRQTAGTQPAAGTHIRRADFEKERKSEQARQMADWVTDSGDNNGMPFAIVDKVDARVFVFDSHGRLRGAAPVLLGLSRGDYAVPGIGDRKLADIRPEERTTAAGRFVAYLGYNSTGKDVLWVDYKNAVSLHRVITNNPKERRLERLASSTPLDKRISYGCINVPAKFFDKVVKPNFTKTYGIVYVLPETRRIGEIFRAYYDVDARWRRTASLNENTRARLQPVSQSSF